LGQLDGILAGFTFHLCTFRPGFALFRLFTLQYIPPWPEGKTRIGFHFSVHSTLAGKKVEEKRKGEK
jgi:hypothetical protein